MIFAEKPVSTVPDHALIRPKAIAHDMTRNPNRRDVLKTTATLAAGGWLGAGSASGARGAQDQAKAAKAGGAKSLRDVDAMLRAATHRGDLPGVVALAATDGGIVYEGAFGSRRLENEAAMTRDTVFRIASMVKLVTSVAALQLVEQGKLSLDAPVPAVDPAVGEPQVLDGFDDKGKPRLRPAMGPISLRQLLTHTSGFAYRLWDAKARRYHRTIAHMPQAERAKMPEKPLMFDPGGRWQYGGGIDWVGRIVEAISGEPVDAYFRKHITGPLGMSDTVFVLAPEQSAREAGTHRRRGDGTLRPLPVETRPPHPRHPPQHAFTGGGGIYSTAPDYLTLTRALLAGGALGGVRILRPETAALMGRNQIGDLDVGVLRTTEPAISNDVDFFPGITLKWGFGHMINMEPVPGARSAGSMTWGGILNTYYWIDPMRRVAAVFMTQVLPFADYRALQVYRQFERGIYAAVEAG